MLSLHLLVHVPCQSNAGRCTSPTGRCRSEQANQMAASSMCPPVDATHVLVESSCPPVVINVVSVESFYCFPPLSCPTWHTLSWLILNYPSVSRPLTHVRPSWASHHHVRKAGALHLFLTRRLVSPLVGHASR